MPIRNVHFFVIPLDKARFCQSNLLMFSVFLHETNCESTLEAPHRSASNPYPKMFSWTKYEKKNKNCRPSYLLGLSEKMT